MITQKALRRNNTRLKRTIRSCTTIECIIVCLSWVMLMSYADISNAQQKASNKNHLEPEHRIEFRSGATPSNPLDFNRPYSRIVGYLYKPKGEGRYPAVVLIHDVDGIHRIHIEWAKRLAAWGYVSLVVDSRNRLDPGGPGFSPMMMAQDAYGALKHLHGLAFVDPARIAVMGWSYGANAIMSALKANPQQPSSPTHLFTKDPNYRFKAGITYYPLCSPVETTMYAPMLIFVGDKDILFKKNCDTFPKENRAGGEPYRITVYPGATHYFDYGEVRPDQYQMQQCVPDPSATQDAIERVKAFLQEKL